jgi:hypothetical protein
MNFTNFRLINPATRKIAFFVFFILILSNYTVAQEVVAEKQQKVEKDNWPTLNIFSLEETVPVGTAKAGKAAEKTIYTWEIDEAFLYGFSEGNELPQLYIETFNTNDKGEKIKDTIARCTYNVDYSNFREVENSSDIAFIMDCKIIPDPKKNILPKSLPLTFQLAFAVDKDYLIAYDENMKKIKVFEISL